VEEEPPPLARQVALGAANDRGNYIAAIIAELRRALSGSGCSLATAPISLIAFRLIAAALESLPVRSCLLDGEAIAVDERGLPVLAILRCRLRDHAAMLCAFDLIEIDGKDLRWRAIEHRKATLADLLCGIKNGSAFNQHFAGDGTIIFKRACALGCEGIVSKRLGSHYRSGRVNHWLKIKNPASPAVKREAEEDWGDKRWARRRQTPR
jgi:hypothetical protein